MPIYSAIYDGPPNGYTATKTKKRYIVIHNTANDAPAQNEASYAKRRTDSVSSHYYVDGKEVIQSLNTDYKAWHAGSSTGNSYGIAYEVVGTNAKSRTWWLANVAWDKLAKQVATDMRQFGIKNRHLTIAQMRDGVSTGIVTHDDMRRAWGGTTHTDPGANFPMDYLIKKVNEYLNPPKPVVPVNEEDELDAVEKSQLAYVDGRVLALAEGSENVRQDLLGGGSPVWLVTKVKELDAKMDRILAALEADK